MVWATNAKSITCFIVTGPCWCAQKKKTSINSVSVFPGRAGNPCLKSPHYWISRFKLRGVEETSASSHHTRAFRGLSTELFLQPFHLENLCSVKLRFHHREHNQDRLLKVIEEISAQCYTCISLSYIVSPTASLLGSFLAAGSQSGLKCHPLHLVTEKGNKLLHSTGAHCLPQPSMISKNKTSYRKKSKSSTGKAGQKMAKKWVRKQEQGIGERKVSEMRMKL